MFFNKHPSHPEPVSQHDLTEFIHATTKGLNAPKSGYLAERILYVYDVTRKDSE